MKFLFVIDMQNDFIDGALGTPEALAIVPAVKNKIKKYCESGDYVIFTRDTHHPNYLETLEGKNLPIEHCIKGTSGWQIRDELEANHELFHIVDKYTFGYYDWFTYIANMLPDQLEEGEYLESIEIVGLCTDICVISNAMILKSLFTETPIIVDSSCCAGVTPESHKNALEAMKMCQITVI